MVLFFKYFDEIWFLCIHGWTSIPTDPRRCYEHDKPSGVSNL